jgi:hypothetical protein
VTDAPALLGLVVAALGGAAVGVERQRSGHASGAQARLGGVRTFTLLGGVSGLAGWLTTLQLNGLALVLAAGAVALVISGYVAASGRDVDATTEAAALVVIGAGLAAGAGWGEVASAIIAVTTLLLVEKSEPTALVGRIDDEELRAAARFGVSGSSSCRCCRKVHSGRGEGSSRAHSGCWSCSSPASASAAISRAGSSARNRGIRWPACWADWCRRRT